MDLDYLPLTAEVTAADFNALLDQLRDVLAGGQSGSSPYVPSGIGGGMADVGPSGIWAKITGGGTGGKYAWERVIPLGNGSVLTPGYPDLVKGTVTVLPAVEVTGSGSVPSGAVVKLEQSQVGPWFDFGYGAAAAAVDNIGLFSAPWPQVLPVPANKRFTGIIMAGVGLIPAFFGTTNLCQGEFDAVVFEGAIRIRVGGISKVYYSGKDDFNSSQSFCTFAFDYANVTAVEKKITVDLGPDARGMFLQDWSAVYKISDVALPPPPPSPPPAPIVP